MEFSHCSRLIRYYRMPGCLSWPHLCHWRRLKSCEEGKIQIYQSVAFVCCFSYSLLFFLQTPLKSEIPPVTEKKDEVQGESCETIQENLV